MGKFDKILLLSDIDGTLTDREQALPQSNLEAIQYFKANGGAFTIATGRLHDYFRERGFDKLINAPCVLLNGAGIYDFKTNSYLKLCSFNDDYKKTVEYAMSIGGYRFIHYLYKNGGIDSRDIDYIPDSPCKFVVVFDDEECAVNMCNALQQRYKDRYNIFRSWNTGVEVLPKGANKGIALEYLKQMLANITVTAAIGDYENDIALLEHADISFATGNAIDVLKSKADYIVCDHSNGAVKEMIDILDKMYK